MTKSEFVMKFLSEREPDSDPSTLLLSFLAELEQEFDLDLFPEKHC